MKKTFNNKRIISYLIVGLIVVISNFLTFHFSSSYYYHRCHIISEIISKQNSCPTHGQSEQYIITVQDNTYLVQGYGESSRCQQSFRIGKTNGLDLNAYLNQPVLIDAIHNYDHPTLIDKTAATPEEAMVDQHIFDLISLKLVNDN